MEEEGADARPEDLLGKGWRARFDGERYQERFDALAEAGANVHGEADFVSAFVPESVLDAGCGTGRVAIELARRGHYVVGADRDASMLAVARRRAEEAAEASVPLQVSFVEADLVGLDLGIDFDVVLMAGNVPHFAEPGTEPELVAGVARHVRPGGLLVSGFQLDRKYKLSDYDAQCGRAGLVLEERYSTWEREPFLEGGDYAVSVHRRP